jgi:hypothetical protein
MDYIKGFSLVLLTTAVCLPACVGKTSLGDYDDDGTATASAGETSGGHGDGSCLVESSEGVLDPAFEASTIVTWGPEPTVTIVFE